MSWKRQCKLSANKQKVTFYKKVFGNKPNKNNKRIHIVLSIFGLIIFLIILRLFQLTFFEKGITHNITPNKRSSIVDIKNSTLAFSEERYNIYLSGKKAPLSQNQISNLSRIFYQNKKIIARINQAQKDKKVILLDRYTTKETFNKIKKINLPSVLIDKVLYRHYPYNQLLSQTIGFVGHDGSGFYGLEYKYNNFLNYQADYSIEKKLVLNINSDFQRKIEKIIKKSIIKNNATYGNILVQEVKTGRIIAIANYPQINLNKFKESSQESYLNKAVSYLVEPGSIFKIFYIAYLMEKHKFSLSEKRYHCKGYYELPNGEIIKDHGVHGDVSIEDIIKYSCNAGMIQAIEKLEPNEMYNFLTRFKIKENHGIDLPNETKGLIVPLKNWGLRTKATIALGQGLAITPLYLINMFSALIGNGYLYSPKIVRYKELYRSGELIEREEIVPRIINKVISSEVSQKVTKLLHFGTIKGSTGYSSRQSGFEEVFGKTATSQLADFTKGGYHTNRYHSMFIGGYPIQNPKYSVLVVVSQPQKEYYGGKVAAPIFSKVIEELAQYYELNSERTIEKYKNFLIEENPSDEFIEEKLYRKIPNFHGMSIRKAVVLLEDFKKIQAKKGVQVGYKIKGNGFVNTQTPPPESFIKKNQTIILNFK